MTQENTPPAAEPTLVNEVGEAVKDWAQDAKAATTHWWGLDWKMKILKIVGPAVFVLYVWGWLSNPLTMLNVHTYRMMAFTPTQTQHISECGDRDNTDLTGSPCSYDRVFGKMQDGRPIELRNNDSASFILRLLVKSESSRIQNELDQRKGQEVMLKVTGIRWPLFSFFPNVITHPVPYSDGGYSWGQIKIWIPKVIILGCIFWFGRSVWRRPVKAFWWVTKVITVNLWAFAVGKILRRDVSKPVVVTATGPGYVDRAKAWMTGLWAR